MFVVVAVVVGGGVAIVVYVVVDPEIKLQNLVQIRSDSVVVVFVVVRVVTEVMCVITVLLSQIPILRLRFISISAIFY